MWLSADGLDSTLIQNGRNKNSSPQHWLFTKATEEA